MVRRGSTVRVRPRALQRPRKPGLLFRLILQTVERDVGMEPFMEPSGAECLSQWRNCRLCASASLAGTTVSWDPLTCDAGGRRVRVPSLQLFAPAFPSEVRKERVTRRNWLRAPSACLRPEH